MVVNENGQNPLDERLIKNHLFVVDKVQELIDNCDAYGPEAIGHYLRKVRIANNLSLQDIAKQTFLRPTQIEAIEVGRVEELPGRVYSIGYVRSYANIMGLDGEDIVKRFKNQIPDGQDSSLDFTHQPQRESHLPSLNLVLICVLILVVAGLGWVLYKHRISGNGEKSLQSELEQKIQEITSISDSSLVSEQQDLAPTNEQTRPSSALESGDSGVEDTLLDEKVRDQASADPIVVAQGEVDPKAKSIGGRNGASDEDEPTSQEPSLEASQGVSVSSQGRQIGEQNGSAISIYATRDSFVEIKDSQNNFYLRRVLRVGDTFYVPDKIGLELLTSNAGGVILSINGKVMPPLGQENKILGPISLNLDDLLSMF